MGKRTEPHRAAYTQWRHMTLILVAIALLGGLISMVYRAATQQSHANDSVSSSLDIKTTTNVPYFVIEPTVIEPTVIEPTFVEMPVELPVELCQEVPNVPVEQEISPLIVIENPEPFYYDVPLSRDIQDYVRDVCDEYDVPMTLVLAMIATESTYQADVISVTDDYGYMQINICNHTWLSETLGVSDFLDPKQNILCGVSIIGSYIEKYDGDYTKALMAYNMGDYGARKAWESGITSTNYSSKILGLMDKYEDVQHE